MSQNLQRIVVIGAAVGLGVLVAGVLALIFGPDEPLDDEPVLPAVASADLHDDIIRLPPGFGTMRTGLKDIHGDAIGVPCSTCHTEGDLGNPPANRVEELHEFHLDMEFDHGNLGCSSCHAADDRDKLVLAGGHTIDFDDSIEMCAQCHSSTYRSYQHGAHGGMSGHWDRSAGPRERNHCAVCHDSHNPAFPAVMPAPPPRDRYFSVPTSDD